MHGRVEHVTHTHVSLSSHPPLLSIRTGAHDADVMLRLKREMYANEERRKLKEMHDKHAAVVCAQTSDVRAGADIGGVAIMIRIQGGGSGCDAWT